MSRQEPVEHARGYIHAAIVSLDIAKRVLPADHNGHESLHEAKTLLQQWLDENPRQDSRH